MDRRIIANGQLANNCGTWIVREITSKKTLERSRTRRVKSDTYLKIETIDGRILIGKSAVEYLISISNEN